MIYMRQPKNIFALKITCYIWQFPSPSLGTVHVSWVAVYWAGQRVLNDLLRARLSRGGRMIWLLAYPLPPLPSVSSTDDSLEDRGNLLTGEKKRGKRGGQGEKLNHNRKKAWSSINHSVLSGQALVYVVYRNLDT